MMDTVLNSKDDRKARIAAFLFALILLFLILYPFWSYTFPPPEKAGILVSFGEFEVTGGDDIKVSQLEEVEEPDDGEKREKTSELIQKQEERAKKAASKVETVNSKVASAEASPVVINEKAKTKNKVVQESKEAVAEKKAAEEAKKKEEYERAKKQFGDLLGKGTGKGGKTGNAGDPGGDPSTSALSGLSKGSGKIQGGLSDRGLLYEPEIDENSQKSGKVVVKVCVNNRGEVTEASYTQRGSTTTDSGLVKAAIDGSKKYRFSKSPIDKQCGTITIEFKLK